MHVHTQRMDGWIYETVGMEKHLSAARYFPVSLPDVSLLLQCAGSSAWTFPMQDTLHIILQGDNRLSHCRLGK